MKKLQFIGWLLIIVGWIGLFIEFTALSRNLSCTIPTFYTVLEYKLFITQWENLVFFFFAIQTLGLALVGKEILVEPL